MTRRVLPDSTEITLGYDRNGNLTSLTPPGKPAHTFTYDAVDLIGSYTAPNVGSGSSTTEYTFDLDRQLTRVLRPDSTEIDMAYDSAGRLSTVTIPRGTYACSHSATTGQVSGITSPDSVELEYSYDGSLLTSVEWAGPVNGSVDVTHDNGRCTLARATIALPLVGALRRDAMAAAFARLVGGLLSGGAPLLTALDDARGCIADPLAQEESTRIRARIREGASLRQALAEGNLFPPLLTQLVAVGEDSGRLPAFLAQAATILERRTERTVERLVTLAEPAMIVLFGGVVGLVALALLQAVYGINAGTFR